MLILTRYRGRASSSEDPWAGDHFLPGATRVTSMRVLGAVLSANLTMGNHLDEILSSSASSIHALRMLRSHGQGSPQLHVIARSTTLACMLYNNNNNNFRVSNIRVSNRTLIYNVCPEAALT